MLSVHSELLNSRTEVNSAEAGEILCRTRKAVGKMYQTGKLRGRVEKGKLYIHTASIKAYIRTLMKYRDKKQYFSVSDMASYLAVTEKSIHHFVTEGRLARATTKFAGRDYWTRADAMKAIKAYRQNSAIRIKARRGIHLDRLEIRLSRYVITELTKTCKRLGISRGYAGALAIDAWLSANKENINAENLQCRE